MTKTSKSDSKTEKTTCCGGSSKPCAAHPPRQTEDPRRLARQSALQFLHQLSVQNGQNIDQLDDFLAEFSKNDQASQLARPWIRGVWQNVGQIDQIIEQASINWDLARISLVDSSNLRLAVYQLVYCPDIPAKVVINEAIELAKLFSTAEAPRFVNGILDVILGKLKSKPPEQS